MILSFRDRVAEALFKEGSHRKFGSSSKIAVRKLFMLNNADVLEAMRFPPGNRLEALHGDRAGQHSIRVNDQYRICFVWTSSGAENVEIVDYH
ncbi:type II toxin-antitoxin system RelE/ParE family toxin [Granulicella arctica]|uniref:type II toxin-antitoxin system RelE/ParE family toxin n=1 Tax=Granulicella arctica TaxID=940613 RepID=UPI0021E0198B|nr:type II toxin-antitoxin system RelE/ParE family toxin [Granulicella arctica]